MGTQQNWEYGVLAMESIGAQPHYAFRAAKITRVEPTPALVQILAGIGAEGWELAGSVDTGHGVATVFKRPA